MAPESAWPDVAAIQDLVCRERHWRDREDWDAMRAAYTDDAQVRVTWFEGSIDDYVQSSCNPAWDTSSLSRHRLSPVVVSVHGDRALAETPALVELRLRSTASWLSAGDTAPYRRSYQFLAYGARGHLPGDIPGDDRPDLVSALYDDAGKWLRASAARIDPAGPCMVRHRA